MMTRKQAFIIADHMVQVDRKIFNPTMTSKDYIKYREEIIVELMR